MRTTLNIADDVLLAAKERARRERRPLGDVVSELARKGLNATDLPEDVAEPEGLYGFEPLPHRGPVVSNELIDALRNEDPD